MKLRAVLFDLDGVLVDSYALWFHLLNAVARKLRYPAISREMFASNWGQGIEADVREFYTRHTAAEIEQLYQDDFLDHWEHLGYHPKAAEVLAALRARGLATAVITNTPGPLVSAILERGGLVMDVVVGGTEVPRAKPAPDMVLVACERLGLAPGEAVVVGDTRFDREAAAAAGVRFAGLGVDGDVHLERLEQVLELVDRVA